jgi:transposase
MRYELNDHEWAAIKPMLPNKPRGVPRVNDRRVLNGIFWVLRSGAPWRDLPDNFGPYTTCYNRFVRWRRAGVWAKLMSALAGAHDAAVQMIDTSIVRVHPTPMRAASARARSTPQVKDTFAGPFDVGWNSFTTEVIVPHDDVADSEPFWEGTAELYVKVAVYRRKTTEIKTDWDNSQTEKVRFE